MLRLVLVKLIIPLAIIFIVTPKVCEAHQPRIVTPGLTEITNPEVSQAFYGDLKGENNVFHLKSDKQFNLYVGIVIPDNKFANKQISAEIYQQKNNKKKVLYILDGAKHTWEPFYEEFAQDNYLRGPEYKSPESTNTELKGNMVPAGDYYIRIYSPNNLGKYSLVTGYLEEFPPKEIANTLFVVPQLKFSFFNYSLLEIIRSPYILGPVILILGIMIIIYKSITKLFHKKTIKKSLKKESTK